MSGKCGHVLVTWSATQPSTKDHWKKMNAVQCGLSFCWGEMEDIDEDEYVEKDTLPPTVFHVVQESQSEELEDTRLRPNSTSDNI